MWVNGESLLAKLYPNRVILPEPVYNEIKKVPHLLAQVNVMKNNNALTIMPIHAGTDEYRDYSTMTQSPVNGEKVIGRGEAAGIALTKKYNGTLASNNLRDIAGYVAKYHLKHITTGDILIEALNQGLITEAQGNQLWLGMLAKRRKLPTATFSDYLLMK